MRERGRRIVERIDVLDVVPLGPPVEDVPITVLWPRSRNLAPKVRVVVDALVDAFRPVPPWDLNWPASNRTQHC